MYWACGLIIIFKGRSIGKTMSKNLNIKNANSFVDIRLWSWCSFNNLFQDWRRSSGPDYTLGRLGSEMATWARAVLVYDFIIFKANQSVFFGSWSRSWFPYQVYFIFEIVDYLIIIWVKKLLARFRAFGHVVLDCLNLFLKQVKN